MKILIHEFASCRIYGRKITDVLRNNIDDILQKVKNDTTPLIQVQVAAIQYFEGRNQELFFKFEKAYFSHFKDLHNHKGFLLISLVNALAVILKPNETMNMEYLKLYRFGIQHNLLLKNGEISGFRFHNIIYIAEALGDYELLQLAHDKLAHLIADPKERKLCTLLSKAYALFGKGKYEEALKVLGELGNKRNIPDFFLTRRHIFVMKCIFEQYDDKQEAYNKLMKAAASFRKMILRIYEDGQINEDTKQSMYNYINILCRIANQRNPSTKEELYALLESYNGLMVETKYVIAKIEEK